MKEIRKIQLVTLGGADKSLLNEIKSEISQVVNLPVEIIEIHYDITPFFNPSRRQYNANQILELLPELIKSDQSKIIGIFKVDLFIPILTYIFGQAFLNGDYGLVSFHRLQNEKYGLQPDSDLLKIRLTKEILHELGHAFGLIHCHIPGCVMQSSTYVEEIDLKNAAFCHTCNEHLFI